jgi:hypothetical protein
MIRRPVNEKVLHDCEACMVKFKFLYALVFLGLLLSAGCAPSDQSEKKKQSDDHAKMLAEKSASEKQLLADPRRATGELIQRLRASLKMRDGLLMVDDQSRFRLLGSASEVAAMASIPGGVSLSVRPRESPWVVNCGTGITVVFGNSISDGSESSSSGRPEPIDTESRVWLTYEPLTKQGCEILAPVIGKEIQAILRGD